MPDEWSELTKEAIPPAPFERAQVRYVINDFKAKPEVLSQIFIKAKPH
jgi:hypothetical protein